MTTLDEHQGLRLAINLDPYLAHRVGIAAAERNASVRDYIVSVLRVTVAQGRIESDRAKAQAWSRLSSRSFARDWDSDADAIYDELA